MCEKNELDTNLCKKYPPPPINLDYGWFMKPKFKWTRSLSLDAVTNFYLVVMQNMKLIFVVRDYHFNHTDFPS